MSGVYGTIRPANLNIDQDVEIFYFYRPTRSTDSEDFLDGFKKLDSSSCLVEAEAEGMGQLFGMYDLRLPLDRFNKKGFYTVYIRPKEIEERLADVSVLAAYPDVKGIVLNMNSSGLRGIDDLTGYRVDYCDGDKRTDITRLITSCNRCEPVIVTIADSYPKTQRYRLTDTGSKFAFCTVTPSSSSSFKPNVTPYIGTAGCKVIISNTKFSPVMLEIEMVDHDADTLTYMIEGDQVRDRDKAIITTYNEDKEIYKQQDYFTVKDSLGNALRDIKRNRTTFDGDQEYDKVVTNE